MSQATIPLGDPQRLLTLFGVRDQNLRKIREALGVEIFARGEEIHIQGEQASVAQATEVIEKLKTLTDRHGGVTSLQVAELLQTVTGEISMPAAPAIELFQSGRQIRPRTAGQARYLAAIDEHDVVLCIGPAGTGKTYLAVAMAVTALRQRRIRKIVLVRPAVEAGESLGFLPGDMQAKINPYLRPLLDALNEMMEYEQFRQLMEQDVVEIVPLAYMRGRTLNEAFIILDEAQNTTVSQMKMFLTRMGLGSKIVVSGDVTQVDLPNHRQSGLTDALTRLRHIEGVASVELTARDIVRHRLVQQIVGAYETDSKPEQGNTRRRRR
jgi:phosphate starvation-inducible PhoH-like protein